MVRHDSVLELRVRKGEDNGPCTTRVEGKQTRTRIVGTTADCRFTVLEAVNTDISEPMKVHLKGEAQYFETFIDKESCWIETCPIRLLSDVFASFKEYMAQAERQTERKLNFFFHMLAESS